VTEYKNKHKPAKQDEIRMALTRDFLDTVCIIN